MNFQEFKRKLYLERSESIKVGMNKAKSKGIHI